MDKRMKTACFTGHRDIPISEIPIIKNRLKSVIASLVEKGVIYFGNGAAYGFDLIAAETVLEMKQKYPQIFLILVLPCRNQTEKWQDEREIKRYYDILDKADKMVCLSERHYKDCELARNRHLVDNSGYCICYLTQNSGGTSYTIDYAKRNSLKIYNIAKEII